MKMRLFFTIVFVSYSFLIAADKINPRFTLKNTIVLQEPDSIQIGNIQNIQSNSSGELLVLNRNAYMKYGCSTGNRLTLFDKDGKFIRNIGKPGEGVNEISNFKSFTIKDDTIYVADDVKGCIHILHKNGEYISNFDMKSMNCWRLYITGDRVITYDPVVSQAFENLIQVQNTKTIYSKFGTPSIIARKAFPCPNYGFTINSQNSIFQVNSHEYKIYNYSLTGELLNIFTNSNQLSKCKSLPETFEIKRDTSRAYYKNFRDSFNWIHYLYLMRDKYLILVYVDSEMNFFADIISTTGEFIKTSIKLDYDPKGWNKNGLFLIPEREEKSLGTFSPQKILFYTLNGI